MLLMIADGDRRHQRRGSSAAASCHQDRGHSSSLFGFPVKIRLLVSSNENSDIFRTFLLTEIVKMRNGNSKIRKKDNKTGDVDHHAFAMSRI